MTDNQGIKNDPHNPTDQIGWDSWQASRALRYYYSEVERIRKEAEAHIKEIEDWRDKELTYPLSRIEHIEEDFAGYLRFLRKDNPKAIISTPYARISTRKSKKWEYDEDAIVKDGRYVKTEVKPDKAAIKAEYKPRKVGDDWIAVNADGEALDLVNITEEEKTVIKINPKEEDHGDK